MKAIEYEKYGAPEVLKLVEVEQPVPLNHEVLIKISATTVTATEAKFRQGKPLMTRLFTGLRKPKFKRLGEELAGEIIQVGSQVKRFKVGDQVFGTAGPNFGANAEFICLPEDGVITHKPQHLSYGEAAASIDGFLTAMPFLRDTGQIKKGQKVLINGASGSVGSAAVQIAKYFNTEVTGVCSTANISLVKALGADHVIDYTQTDFASLTNQYDIIFDAVGKRRYSSSKKALSQNGVFLEAGVGLGILPAVLWTTFFSKRKAKIAATGLRPPQDRLKDLKLLKKLLESGSITPLIDRTYQINEINQAHAYVDSGRKKGNVVIEI